MPEIIPGFPAHIREVPEERTAWLRWRDDVLAFREWCHRQCEESHEKRAMIVKLAASDPAFFMAVFGSLHDPRGRDDYGFDEDGNVVETRRPRGWYPWIPYPFQVRMLRWIDDVLATDDDERGKADGVIEKSRDMGATWLFALRAAHHWLFADDMVIGFYSHKEAAVDSKDPKSIFFKVRALLGFNRKVPAVCHAPGTIYDGARIRLPDFLIPIGFEGKLHNLTLNILHPTKSNQIVGEATTSKSGIGSRTSYIVFDEAAKTPLLLDIWSGMGPVSDHRFALSSADRREGDGMYLLVEQAKASERNPDVSGPAYMRLTWDLHPMRDDAWYRREKSRYLAANNDEAGFSREYEIDWNAGMGDWVYPVAHSIVPGPYPWDPLGGQDYISIDPGIRDPTAIECFQGIPGTGQYRLHEALVLKTPSAAWLAPILMGWPPGHPAREPYPDMAIQEFMDTMWEIRKAGRTVQYVGDPYGDSVGGSSSETFYTGLFFASQEINQQYTDVAPVELAVMTKYDEGARYHRGRKEALTKLIPRLQFNDTPRVRYIVDAIQNYRYKSQDESRAVQNEPNNPAHDWSSHPTTCAEYLAVIVNINDLTSGPLLKPVKSGHFRTPTSPRLPSPGYQRML